MLVLCSTPKLVLWPLLPHEFDLKYDVLHFLTPWVWCFCSGQPSALKQQHVSQERAGFQQHRLFLHDKSGGTQLPYRSICAAGEGEHSPGAAPPCPQALSTSPIMTFCPSMQSRMCWAQSRCQLFCMDLQEGSCGGTDRLCLKLEELIQGRSTAPLPLGDNHPKETQLLVAISKNTPSTAALCKKERSQDNRLILLLPLNGHQATFCALLGAKVWEQPCLGQLQPGQAD